MLYTATSGCTKIICVSKKLANMHRTLLCRNQFDFEEF